MLYISQDISKIDRGVIAHGVNCMGVMGSGVAKQLRNTYPAVFMEYRTMYENTANKKALLGTCNLVAITEELYIANCFTQVFYGHNGKFANMKAIKTSLSIAYEWANFFKLPLFLPLIGTGRGGLDWATEVEPIIKDLEMNQEKDQEKVDIYICLWDEK